MDQNDSIEPGAEPAENTEGASEKLPFFTEDPSQLDGFDHAAVLAALEESESGPSESAEPAASTAEETTDAAPVAEEETPVVTEEEAPPAETENTETQRAPKRVSVAVLPADEQIEIAAALDRVRRGEAPNLRAALGMTASTAPVTEAAPAAEATPPAQTATPQPSAKVEEITQQMAALREQRAKAKRDFDTDTEIELTEKIEGLGLDLIRAENSARQEATDAAVYTERFNAAGDIVEATYPDAADETSVFARVLADRVTAAQARGDAALKDPNFITRFADEVAADLGIQKGPKTAPTPATPPPAKPARPVGTGLAPGSQTTLRPSREQLSNEVQQMPIEELEKLVCTE